MIRAVQPRSTPARRSTRSQPASNLENPSRARGPAQAGPLARPGPRPGRAVRSWQQASGPEEDLRLALPSSQQMAKAVEQVDHLIVRFAGDSGDRLELTGDRFPSRTAV